MDVFEIFNNNKSLIIKRTKVKTLQNVILPNEKTGPAEAYYRSRTHDLISIRSHGSSLGLEMKAGSDISLDTFYNAFPLAPWTSCTELKSLYLSITVKGCLDILLNQAILKRNKLQISNILEYRTNNFDYSESILQIPYLSLRCGLLFVEIKAITDVSIENIRFVTQDDAIQKVKLGLVVTHYRREACLRNFIEQFIQEDTPDKLTETSLLVVDNSGTLVNLPKSNRVKVIKNQNYGGSGGFARGLLELSNGDFTHCCFMDDDANSNIENFLRTVAFFKYAKPGERISIAGILLQKNTGSFVIERAARFDKRWHPISRGIDICNLSELLQSESSYASGEYGAWCYFAFKISDVKKYPFPFFVRGDDILFGLQNGFKVISLIGVAALVDSFELKDGPVTRYLGCKSELIINTLIRNSVWDVCSRYKSWYLHSLNSYNYASCDAINQAVDDFLQGPKWIVENIALGEKLSAMKRLHKDGVVGHDISMRCLQNKKQERKIIKFVRRISLQGLLIPSFFFTNNISYQKKGFSADLSTTFLHKYICYLNPENGEFYITKHDKNKIFKGYIELSKRIIRIIWAFHQIQKLYIKYEPKICVKSFWINVYKLIEMNKKYYHKKGNF